MARRESDLSQVQLGSAARQVNTFVAGRNTPNTNSAIRLSEALTSVGKIYAKEKQRQEEVNIEQATERKLYGGTMFSYNEGMATAGYEEVKDQLGSVEQAQQWYLESTMPDQELADPHTLSGYSEAQRKAMGKFLGNHAEYLTGKRIESRTRDVMNDFFFNVTNGTTEEAYSRLGQIAQNYGMKAKDLNGISLGAAEVLISQERFKEAEEILTFKRGAAGSLVSHPDTAIEANKLLSKVKTEDTITIANQIKSFEDATENSQPFTVGQKQIMDNLLKDGQLTINQRNNLLQENEKAVKIDNLSTTLAQSLSTPGRSFFDPIPGATIDESEAARKRFTDKFYDDVEGKRGDGTIDPVAYATRNVRFSERTNSTNPAIKARLGAGFSAFNANQIVETGTIDQNTIKSVAEYMLMYKENPQVAAAHAGTNATTRDFFDNILMDVELGGFPGDQNERIERALKNYAYDSVNPIKGSSDIRISDDEVITLFETISDSVAGWSFTGNTGKAVNANQWVPYIKRQVRDAARRTGNTNTDQLLKHVTRQIIERSQRIGDYIVPRGTNTFVGSNEDLETLNDRAIGRYIAENPNDGYDADDLVLVPVVGQQNMWGVAVKGSNQILEVIPHGDLPMGADTQETKQILQDEGVVRNRNGEHISYTDSRGFLTGGHGHLLTEEEKKKYPKGTVIPQEVVEQWKEQDLKEAEEDVSAIFGDVNHPEVKSVLTNMAFNLGRTKLNKFEDLKEAVRNNDFIAMADAMKDSAWYDQVGNRSRRLIDRIRSLA